LAASQRNNKNEFPPERMKEICRELSETFEYVLIDCPAGIEQGFFMSTASANEAIIITTPEVAAIRDADRIIGLVQDAGIEKPSLIINRLSSEMIERGDMMGPRDILDVLAIDLIGIIPEDREIIVATNKGLPLTLTKNSPSGEAYKRVARRINGEKGLPIPDFREDGFLAKLAKIFRSSGEGG
jgi:septum site-determining protein MinD